LIGIRIANTGKENQGGEKKMKCTYEVTVQKDGDWYVAWADDVPGAITQGRTLKEVEENIKDAIQLTLQTKSELKALKSKARLRKMKVQVEVDLETPRTCTTPE